MYLKDLSLEERRLKLLELNKIIEASHARSTRAALLEHARMGRSVPEGTPDGRIIWITPTEIFARYGFDEFGRPQPANEPTS